MLVRSSCHLEEVANIGKQTVSGHGDNNSKTLPGTMLLDPLQTLIFFDWDDTLFPLHVIHICPLQPTDQLELQRHEDAVIKLLCAACSLSNRCAIITNAQEPWVDKCIDGFMPGLKPFMNAKRASGQITITYAKNPVSCRSKLRPVMRALMPLREVPADELTTAKYHAMKREAKSFYSQNPGQAWENILSFGDGEYEHHAVQEVTWRYSCSRKKHCRTKAVMLPESPTIDQLTLTLQWFGLQLPVFVNFDGDIDISLQTNCGLWMDLAAGM